MGRPEAGRGAEGFKGGFLEERTLELGLRVMERRTLETQRTAYLKESSKAICGTREECRLRCGEIRLAKLVDAIWKASQGDRQGGQDRILGVKWRG